MSVSKQKKYRKTVCVNIEHELYRIAKEQLNLNLSRILEEALVVILEHKYGIQYKLDPYKRKPRYKELLIALLERLKSTE